MVSSQSPKHNPKDNHADKKIQSVRYGLSISVQQPIVDWTKATRASYSLSSESSTTVTSHTDAQTEFIRIAADKVSRVSLVVNPQGTCMNNFHILVEPLAHATIVVQTTSNTSSQYNQKIKLEAAQGSTVSLVCIQLLTPTSVGFFDTAIVAAKDAKIEVLSLDTSSSFVRRSVVANLIEEGASCNQQIISLCENQQHDLYTESNHIAPRTTSDILTRTAVLSAAKSVSRSLVRIGENAFGSEGYEKQEALLLSPDAEADAIPNLQIHNHDVKCSHGSTIGQLDEEKIYYLMSRGLSRKVAIRCMLEGYFMPAIRSIPDQATCIMVQDCIRKIFAHDQNQN